MSNTSIIPLIFALLCFSLICVSLGICLGAYDMVSHKEAIQHGAAHYDPVTAKFTWNSSATTPTLTPEALKAPKP